MNRKTAALCLLCLFCGFLIGLFAFRKNYQARHYPRTTVVVSVDRENDTVTCEDGNGTIWVFKGAEDWMVGDCASLLMDTMGTPRIYDDEIVTARYNGQVSWPRYRTR